MTSFVTSQGSLFQGDCIGHMNAMPESLVDLIVTDPPYLVNYLERGGRKILNDNQEGWVADAYKAMFRILKPDAWAVTFFGTTKVDVFAKAWKTAGFRIIANVVFPKSYASSSKALQWKHETAYLLAKGKPKVQNPLPTVLPWKYTENRLHPTQKPIEAILPLIQSLSAPGGLVCDPFAGSATTCVAAMRAQRQFMGIELDPRYYRLALSRVKNEVNTLPMLKA